jgi:hypothetical protein
MEIGGVGQYLNQANGLENRAAEKRVDDDNKLKLDEQRDAFSRGPLAIETPIKTLSETPVERIVTPNESTIQQLDSSSAARLENNSNSSGLGEVAANSYQSLARSEEAQQLSDKIKVDITV